MNLSYIIEKIKNAEFSDFPFKHLEINNLFLEEDFEEIIKSQEIAMEPAQDDEKLFNLLFDNNYRIISFPGCTEDYKEYITWHKNKTTSHKANTSCDGFGVALRLQSAKSTAIGLVQEFFNSPEFIDCLAEKFNLNANECIYDSGVQKYLDGYEISPHPDVRRKALTYMVNINPSPTSSLNEHHTSYFHFKPQWNYVQEFWKGNENYDRCWVPWDWCDDKKQQRQNNSMVIFAPDNDTIHAVKANYDHLSFQRTQIYGNLWHKQLVKKPMPEWEDFIIADRKISILEESKKQLSKKVLTAMEKLKRIVTKSSHAKNTSTHSKKNIY